MFFGQGADVSAADYDLRTPLHIAARWVFDFESRNLHLAFNHLCFKFFIWNYLEKPTSHCSRLDFAAYQMPCLPQILAPFHPQKLQILYFFLQWRKLGYDPVLTGAGGDKTWGTRDRIGNSWQNWDLQYRQDRIHRTRTETDNAQCTDTNRQ